MLFAGHDTSASALTLALLYLKQQPDALQKLREEQCQVRSLPLACCQYACAIGLLLAATKLCQILNLK